MIIIIFLSLAAVYFLVQYFENRRRKRNEDYHERKRDSFNRLLDTLREKNSTDESANTNEHEP